MIKTLTIGIVALVILLVGATVVLAQDGTPGFGGTMQGRMMRTSATTPDGSTTTPTPGNPAGTGAYGMMNPDTLNAMRDAMQSGDWQHMHDLMGQYVPEQMQGMHDAMGQAMQSGDPQQMYDTCQNYFNGQNPGTDGSTAPTGMMGGNGTSTGPGTMMGGSGSGTSTGPGTMMGGTSTGGSGSSTGPGTMMNGGSGSSTGSGSMMGGSSTGSTGGGSMMGGRRA